MPGRDWTTTSAKWAAVVVLGGASIAGMAWSMSRPKPAVVLIQPETQVSTTAPKADTTAPARTPTPPAPALAATPAPEAAASPVRAAPALRAAAGTLPHQINLNTATQPELELLPGIGPALARRILDHRESKGKFATVDQLDDVKGIGPKTLEKLRPLVRVD